MGWSAELDALYATLPALVCQGLCADSCGPIGVGAREGAALHTLTGRPLTFQQDMRCTFLNRETKRCEVYTERPLICRLYGSVAAFMACPHGCVPERWLSADEAVLLLNKAAEMTGVPGQPVADASVPSWIANYYRRLQACDDAYQAVIVDPKKVLGA